jgi:hypothetical protein
LFLVPWEALMIRHPLHPLTCSNERQRAKTEQSST